VKTLGKFIVAGYCGRNMKNRIGQVLFLRWRNNCKQSKLDATNAASLGFVRLPQAQDDGCEDETR